MKKKTIGLVLNDTPTYSETFFYNKINALLAEGYRVILFSMKANKVPKNWEVVTPFPLPGNKIIRTLLLAPVLCWLFIRAPKRAGRFVGLEKDAGRNWKTILEDLYINAHILTKKADWLHFGFATPGIRRENTARAIGAKMAVSLRGYDIAVYPLKNPGCYDLLWKRVDKVHTISDDLKILAYRFGLDSHKPVIKITPAIDYNKFKNEYREHTPIVNILTVARLNWKKGLSYSLYAMKILKDKNINFKYTIIGDGGEKENLVFMAYQLGLTEQVVFEGIVPSDKINAYYAQNSIYLQPSVQEGFCNSVLEAQAAGMLCIVSDAEGLQENVIDKVTGWVAPKRNPQAIVAAITNILGMTDEEKKTIIDTARERVKKEFNLEKQTKEFIDFYL